MRPCYQAEYWVQGSLFPRHHPQEGKGLGTLKHFLGLAHHHVTAHVPIQTYANNHTIAELAESRFGVNVPGPFPSWGWGLGTRLDTCTCTRQLQYDDC